MTTQTQRAATNDLNEGDFVETGRLGVREVEIVGYDFVVVAGKGFHHNRLFLASEVKRVEGPRS